MAAVRALILGASGHLGAHLARELAGAGHTVRAFVRPTSDRRGLAGVQGLEWALGDVRDPSAVEAALHACDAVFHLAAPTSLTPDLDDVIERGTETVIDRCARAAVRRVVYVSSIVTVGYAAPGQVLDERSNQLTRATPYHAAKWRAERAALELGRTRGVEVVVVNPATIVGALDHRVTPSNQPIQEALDRGLRFAFDSGVTVVHAADVARGLVAAHARGRAGERYILGGERITIPDYFRLICALCGRPPPLLTLPRSAVLGAGLGFSALRRLGWRGAPFGFGQARALAGRYGWYSSDKARDELGHSWRPIPEAVADYVRWVRAGRPSG